MKQTKTIAYYDRNAEVFLGGSVKADMSGSIDLFLRYLPVGAHILDAGCGSGRDSRAFLLRGCRVTAFDGSGEMVKHSIALTGLTVQHATFEDISLPPQTFDGVWACASLLHVERELILQVLRKLLASLKPGGVLFMSFKYGDREYDKDGRYFNCYDEHTVRPLITRSGGCRLLDIQITDDVRPDRAGEKWLECLLRKL